MWTTALEQKQSDQNRGTLPHSLLLLYFTSMSSMEEFFFSTSMFSSRTFSLMKTTASQMLSQRTTPTDT